MGKKVGGVNIQNKYGSNISFKSHVNGRKNAIIMI